MYANDTSQTPAVCLAFFAHDTCLHATDRKEGHVFRKLQRGLNSSEKWYERWTIKINEVKNRAVYFSHRLIPPEVHLTLNGRNIPFVKLVKYLGVISDKKILWRLHTEKIEGQVFRTFIRVYSLFKI
jgi:hypothetical protein